MWKIYLTARSNEIYVQIKYINDLFLPTYWNCWKDERFERHNVKGSSAVINWNKIINYFLMSIHSFIHSFIHILIDWLIDWLIFNKENDAYSRNKSVRETNPCLWSRTKEHYSINKIERKDKSGITLWPFTGQFKEISLNHFNMIYIYSLKARDSGSKTVSLIFLQFLLYKVLNIIFLLSHFIHSI